MIMIIMIITIMKIMIMITLIIMIIAAVEHEGMSGQALVRKSPRIGGILGVGKDASVRLFI